MGKLAQTLDVVVMEYVKCLKFFGGDGSAGSDGRW